MLAAPILGAMGGGALFGQLGMTAGWMIGSWLLNRKNAKENEIIDPGAEEMPRFNQALRGVTIPVLFGTNKVSSQIIGQWNFTTIRKENKPGGGGGKGGGSGGGKVGVPEQSDISYEYKWDLLYHIGMSHQRMYLYGGWIGVTKIADNSILAITSSSASQGSAILNQDDQPPKEMDLQFEDAFFNDAAYGGGITSNDATWDHLSDPSVIGQQVRWPGSSWVGFKQLLLGSRPAIPQLLWELGPAEADISGNNSLEWEAADFPNGKYLVGSTSFDKFGQAYYMNRPFTSGDVFCIGRDGSKIFQWEPSDLKVLMQAWYGASHTMSLFTFGVSVVPVLGGEYLILISYGQTQTNLAIATPNENAEPTIIGAVWFAHGINVLKGGTTAIVCGNQTVSDPILLVSNSGGSQENTQYQIFPSITDITTGVFASGWGGTIYDTFDPASTYPWGNHQVPWYDYLTGAGIEDCWSVINDSLNLCVHISPTNPGGSSQMYDTVMWGLPYNLSFQTRIYCYWSAQVMHFYNNQGGDKNTYIRDTLAPSYPNGCIGYFDLGSVVYSAHIPDSISDSDGTYSMGAFTVDNDNWENIPFDDARTNFSGDDQDSDWYMTPHVTKIEGGAYAIIWLKTYGHLDDQKLEDTDTYATVVRHKIKVHIWNFFTNTASELTSFAGIGLLTSEVTSVTPSANELWSFIDGRCWYDQVNSELYIAVGSSEKDPAAIDDSIDLMYKFADFSISGGGDITPAEIIYTILTDPILGLGIDTTDVNTDSYNLAKQYCVNNSFVVSTQYRRESTNVLNMIIQLLELYGGYLTVSQEQIKFGMLEYTSIPVRTIDNHHLVKDKGVPPVTVNESAHQDSINRTVVNFIDRTLDYQQNQVVADDEADQEQYGIRKREFPPQFVMSEQMATTLAWRTLYTNLYDPAAFSFKLGPKDADLEPGDVILLVDSFHPYLEEGVNARIASWREVTNGVFEVSAKEEIEYLMTHSQSLLGISSMYVTSKGLGSLSEPDYQVIYELPAEYQLNDQGTLYSAYVTKGGKPFGGTLYASPDGETFDTGQFVSPYPLGGKLLTNLPNAPAGTFQEDVEVLMFPASGWSSNSPTYLWEETLSEAAPPVRAVGGSLIYIGSEMLAYEGVNLVSANHYKFDRIYRGWGGTNIHSHSSGDFWHKHGGGIFSQGFTEANIGQNVQVKVAPVRFNQTEYDVASVNPSCYTIVGRHYGPQNAPTPQFVTSGGVLEFRGRTLININSYIVNSGFADMDFRWEESARKTGFGIGGFGLGTGGYGRFTADQNTVTYAVKIYGSGDIVVRSTTVGSTAYFYSDSANVADNGAWRGNIALTIEPFNQYATAIRTSVVSMELFQ